MNEDPEAALIAAHLRHTIDLLRAEIAALRQAEAHTKEMADHRLAALERVAADHEARLREVSTGVTQFKVWSGLANGGSSIMALIAFVKAWFGV